jgi:hypothetical protein
MGDANAEDIVDEKQWDDKEDKDDDGGEDGRDKEEEKFEKDSKMQGEAIEGEMRTKEDEDDGNDKVVLEHFLRCCVFLAYDGISVSCL